MASSQPLKRYVVIVHCDNILLHDGAKFPFLKRNRVRQMGAYTTRLVSAIDEENAVRLAINSAIDELKSNGIMNKSGNHPRCEVDRDIRQLGEDEIFGGPTAGFTFYREE